MSTDHTVPVSLLPAECMRLSLNACARSSGRRHCRHHNASFASANPWPQRQHAHLGSRPEHHLLAARRLHVLGHNLAAQDWPRRRRVLCAVDAKLRVHLLLPRHHEPRRHRHPPQLAQPGGGQRATAAQPAGACRTRRESARWRVGAAARSPRARARLPRSRASLSPATPSRRRRRPRMRSWACGSRCRARCVLLLLLLRAALL